MARFRLSRPAQADIANILVTSVERWGVEGRRRYAALLIAAMRRVAADPEGSATQDRAELLPGVRSFHIRHARGGAPDATARRPVHVVYFRPVEPGLIEIIRVLHDRMEPRRHLGVGSEDKE
jgi:toxin ParE1/3/4